jgi:alpha-beta hydrolase superfamily lysophospholipase
VEDFEGRFPTKARVQRTFYPESYHLLFYDHQREQVLTDITHWLNKLTSP